MRQSTFVPPGHLTNKIPLSIPLTDQRSSTVVLTCVSASALVSSTNSALMNGAVVGLDRVTFRAVNQFNIDVMEEILNTTVVLCVAPSSHIAQVICKKAPVVWAKKANWPDGI